MKAVRLGAVSYLNARPLVFGLERSPRFALRYDVPAECARLLHAGDIDVGLIPTIEYAREDYRVVPDLAIASRGPVASVALFTSRHIRDVRSIAMDVSSRTSVALVRVLCARLFGIEPSIDVRVPDLDAMLAHADAALVIGDNALLWSSSAEKIDLGEAWTRLTGLPFVWAFWAGRDGCVDEDDRRALRVARDEGVTQFEQIAREYFEQAPEHQSIGSRYLRDNIKYHLGGDERAALEMFFRYAVEVGAMAVPRPLRFFAET
jgi:predicted solute-binding protein